MHSELVMILSAFIYSLQNLNVKVAGASIGFWWIVIFRGIIGAIISLPFCFNKSTSQDIPNRYLLLSLRALMGGITIISGFYAVVNSTSLSQVVLLASTNTFWMVGADYIFDGKMWTRRELVALLIASAGVVIVSYPITMSNWKAITAALFSGMCQAGVITCIRRLHNENTFIITLWGMMGSVVLSIPALVIIQPPINTTNGNMWLLSACSTGILSMMAQALKTYSLQISTSSVVVILRYMDIVFSIMWDIIVFHVHPPIFVYIGSLIILLASVIIITHKK